MLRNTIIHSAFAAGALHLVGISTALGGALAAAVDVSPIVDRRANVFAASTQSEVTLDRTQAGGVVAAWSSRRQQGGRYGVYARRFDAEGRPLGGETEVNLFIDSHQLSPALATAGENTWIAWQSHGQDGDGWSVLVRRFDSALHGGDEWLVPVVTTGNQTEPVVAACPDGGVIVAWIHAQDRAPAVVRARRFSADGSPRTDELSVCGPEGAQGTPAVAVREDGSWALAFSVIDAPLAASAGVWLQRFDAANDRVDDATLVAERGIEPALAVASDGWLAAWLEAEGAIGYGARVARLTGDARVGIVHAAPPMQGIKQSGLALATEAGAAVLAWTEFDGDDADVALVTLAEDGAPSGPARRATNHRDGAQGLRPATGASRVVLLPDGTVVCGWAGDAGLDDGSGAHVSALGLRPAAAIAAAWSVTSPLEAAPSVAAPDVIAAEPHEPPTFETRQRTHDGARELLASGGEIGFTGVSNTGWTPPDPHMAVGPDHLVLMTNGAIAFMTKGGSQTFIDEIEGSFGFWGSLGASGFVFDPEVVYDPMSERFFAMASDRESATSRAYALIAVSDDSDPNGTWYKYRFDATVGGPTFDSPNIGVTADAVIVSGDGIGGQPYPIFIYDKASLLVGAPPAVSNTVFLSTSTQSAGIPPVSFDDPSAVYMLEHRESTSNSKVRLIALRDPLGSPSIVDFLVTVPTYGRPEDPPQAGTSARPETFDARFWSVAYRNGSLWGTHHVGASNVRARWYEIATNGWPDSGADPELVQSGEIDPGAGIRTFFSAITVDDAGNAAVVYARSSPSEFISMATSSRAAGDPLGTMGPSIIRKANTAPYTGSRWGDYAAIDVDPVDGRTMWAHHEYAVGGSWNTWVQSIAPACVASDVDCDGVVGVTDLLAVLATWGPCAGCPEDIDGDGMVGVTDLLAVLADWTDA